MYSNEDFERLFIEYKGGALGRGVSIQEYCHKRNIPYNLFQKSYKNTRHRVAEGTLSFSTVQPARGSLLRETSPGPELHGKPLEGTHRICKLLRSPDRQQLLRTCRPAVHQPAEKLRRVQQ